MQLNVRFGVQLLRGLVDDARKLYNGKIVLKVGFGVSVRAVQVALRRCIAFRPDDASQKRFSWFPEWIQKVRRKV